MKIFIVNIVKITTTLIILISHYVNVKTMPQRWTYPGLWYYSSLPNMYHFRRQVHTPISIAPAEPPTPPRIQAPALRSIGAPKRNVHSSMVHDRCEAKNWGNLMGKCRMSCNSYDGTCTETLITTDCGCTGELHVNAGTMNYVDGVAVGIPNLPFINGKLNACETLHRNGHGCRRCLKGGRGHGKARSQAMMWEPKSCPSKHVTKSKNCLLLYC